MSAHFLKEIDDAARLSTKVEVAGQAVAIRRAFVRPNHWTPFLQRVTNAKEVEQVWALAQQVAGDVALADEFLVRYYTRLERALAEQSEEVRAFIEAVPRDWHKRYPVYYAYPNSLKYGGAPGEPATLHDLEDEILQI